MPSFIKWPNGANDLTDSVRTQTRFGRESRTKPYGHQTVPVILSRTIIEETEDARSARHALETSKLDHVNVNSR